MSNEAPVKNMNSFRYRDFMRLANPLSCAEVEIHQVAKREETPRADTVDGAADVLKQSLLKDYNETLLSSGNCFPQRRSRASSTNSSSGGEEGREGIGEVNCDGPAKSHFTFKNKRMKPRSKSKSKFYTPSPGSSIDDLDDIGTSESNLGLFGSPESNLEGCFRTEKDTEDVNACGFQENASVQNNQLSEGPLSGDQVRANHLSAGQSADKQLSDGSELISTTNVSDSENGFKIRTPSTDRFSDLIAGSYPASSQGDLSDSVLYSDGGLVRPDTLTATDSVTEIATREGGGPVPLSRIKCLVSMTTPRDMHRFGTTSLPGFVEFNMSLDGFGCLFFPLIAPLVPPG